MSHVVLFWASGCESWWIMLWKVVVNHGALPVGWAQWLGIMVCSVKPGGCDVFCREKWLWIMMCYRYAGPSGWEWWCVMPIQWLWIMFCYAEPVVVNHCELWWASGCESWCAMKSQWLWIVVSYAKPVVVNHGELCWASGCESWWVFLSQWLSTMPCYAGPKVVNHGESFLSY